MTALGLVSDSRRNPTRLYIYAIEYTSSEHRGIIMYAETHEARSTADALAYASSRLLGMEAKYGARGYRVMDPDGCFHSSDERRAVPR